MLFLWNDLLLHTIAAEGHSTDRKVLKAAHTTVRYHKKLSRSLPKSCDLT